MIRVLGLFCLLILCRVNGHPDVNSSVITKTAAAAAPVYEIQCRSDLDCLKILPDSICIRGHCECKVGFRPIGTGECINEEVFCRETADCERKDPNSECAGEKCRCKKGFTIKRGSCASEQCQLHVDCEIEDKLSECIEGKCVCKANYRKGKYACVPIFTTRTTTTTEKTTTTTTEKMTPTTASTTEPDDFCWTDDDCKWKGEGARCLFQGCVCVFPYVDDDDGHCENYMAVLIAAPIGTVVIILLAVFVYCRFIRNRPGPWDRLCSCCSYNKVPVEEPKIHYNLGSQITLSSSRNNVSRPASLILEDNHITPQTIYLEGRSYNKR